MTVKAIKTDVTVSDVRLIIAMCAAIIAVMTAVFGFAQWTGISRCQGLLLDIVICLAALVLKP